MALECDECWRKHIMDKWRKVTFFPPSYTVTNGFTILISGLRLSVCFYFPLGSTHWEPRCLSRIICSETPLSSANPLVLLRFNQHITPVSWGQTERPGSTVNPSLQVAFVDPSSLWNKFVPPSGIDPRARQLDSPDNAITWSHKSIAPGSIASS